MAERKYGGIVLDAQGQVTLRKPTGHFGGYEWTFAKTSRLEGESPEMAALRAVRSKLGIEATIETRLHDGGRSAKYWLMKQVKDHGDFDRTYTQKVCRVSAHHARALIAKTTKTSGRKRDLAVLEAAIATQEGARVPAPVARARRNNAITRDLVFSPDGHNVLWPLQDSELPEPAWVCWDYASARLSRLPIGGSCGLFIRANGGEALLTSDATGSWLLPWPFRKGTKATRAPLSFRGDANQGTTALVTEPCPEGTTWRLVRATTKREGQADLELLDDFPAGPPEAWPNLDTRIKRPPWFQPGAADTVGSPFRLLRTADSRKVVIVGYGAAIAVVDLLKHQVALVEGRPDGHPWWAAMHPSKPLVAVLSKRLELFDVEQREKLHELDFGADHKLGGEYCHDGRHFLLRTDHGLVVLDLDYDPPLRRFVRAWLPSNEPVRLSPDGEHAVVPGERELCLFRTRQLIDAARDPTAS